MSARILRFPDRRGNLDCPLCGTENKVCSKYIESEGRFIYYCIGCERVFVYDDARGAS